MLEITIYPHAALFAASEGFSFASKAAIIIFLAGVVLFAAISVLTNKSKWGVPTAATYIGFGVVGALLLHLLDIKGIDPLGSQSALVERLSEFIVIVALFVSGLKISRSFSWSTWSVPLLLVIVVMPLSIFLVAAFANLFLGLSLGAAVLLGAILAPTDPVLAGGVGIEDPDEGDDEEHRFALSAESGLNDGLAFPFVFLAIFIASAEGSWFLEWFSADIVYGTLLGVGAGVFLGLLLRRLLDFMIARGLSDPRYRSWAIVAAIFVVYGITEMIGAYGFLAVFCAALAYKTRGEEALEHYRDLSSSGEDIERVFELVLMVLVGSILTLSGITYPGLLGWIMILAFILLLRPLLVFLVFIRSKLNRKEKLFIGWLGIRGLGSIYYLAVAIGAGVFAAEEMKTVFWITICTVVFSVVVHGLTAEPLTKKLGLHRDHEREDPRAQ